MKNKIVPFLFALAAVFVLPACQTAQLEASAAYIGAEVATTQIIHGNSARLATAQLLVGDWTKFQGGTLTSADEAALLDAATQQLLANQNATAPTPLQGAAAAIITDVMNGVARAIVLETTPASS